MGRTESPVGQTRLVSLFLIQVAISKRQVSMWVWSSGERSEMDVTLQVSSAHKSRLPEAKGVCRIIWEARRHRTGVGARESPGEPQ